MEAVLSTIWVQKRFSHLADFFAAGAEMGFQGYELGHQVNEAMLEEVVPGQYHIPSLHAPCPNSTDIATQSQQDILPSSRHAGRRREAVDMVIRTIDLAARLGASRVVVHLGRVDVDWEIERELRKAFRQGEKGTARYEGLKERLMEQRAAHCQPNLEAVRRSLEELAVYANWQGIKIGLENRIYYTEIPSHEEMGSFLALHPSLFYWHDTGHAQAQANLGFTPHQEWLRSYGERMLGMHFHDIRGLRDHGIPGQGEIDFAGLAPYIPPDALRVCEFDYIYPPGEIVAGREHLVKAGCL